MSWATEQDLANSVRLKSNKYLSCSQWYKSKSVTGRELNICKHTGIKHLVSFIAASPWSIKKGGVEYILAEIQMETWLTKLTGHRSSSSKREVYSANMSEWQILNEHYKSVEKGKQRKPGVTRREK